MANIIFNMRFFLPRDLVSRKIGPELMELGSSSTWCNFGGVIEDKSEELKDRYPNHDIYEVMLIPDLEKIKDVTAVDPITRHRPINVPSKAKLIVELIQEHKDVQILKYCSAFDIEYPNVSTKKIKIYKKRKGSKGNKVIMTPEKLVDEIKPDKYRWIVYSNPQTGDVFMFKLSRAKNDDISLCETEKDISVVDLFYYNLSRMFYLRNKNTEENIYKIIKSIDDGTYKESKEEANEVKEEVK
jgi:hypothetical protein